MRILVADDEPMSRFLLAETLADLEYDVVTAPDGSAAWGEMQRPDAPALAILDWEMPGLSGPDVCRLVRAKPSSQAPYLFLLTVRDRPSDVVAGLESGANDYLTKPFRGDELAARLKVAREMVELQRSLADRVRELEEALAQVKTLRGLLPMCAWCKKVRDDQNYWQQVEDYLCHHSGVQFSHGICPECFHRETG